METVFSTFETAKINQLKLFAELFITENQNNYYTLQNKFDAIYRKYQANPNLKLFIFILHFFEYANSSLIEFFGLLKIKEILWSLIQFKGEITSFKHLQLYSKICWHLFMILQSPEIVINKNSFIKISDFSYGLSQLAYDLWTISQTSQPCPIPSKFDVETNPYLVMTVLNYFQTYQTSDITKSGVINSISTAIANLLKQNSPKINIEAALYLLQGTINILFKNPSKDKYQHMIISHYLMYTFFSKSDPSFFDDHDILEIICKILDILPLGNMPSSPLYEEDAFPIETQFSLVFSTVYLRAIFYEDLADYVFRFVKKHGNPEYNIQTLFLDSIKNHYFYGDEKEQEAIILLLKNITFDDKVMKDNNIGNNFFNLKPRDFQNNLPKIYHLINALLPTNGNSRTILFDAWMHLLYEGFEEAFECDNFLSMQDLLKNYIDKLENFRNPYGLAAYANAIITKHVSVSSENPKKNIAIICYHLLQIDDIKTAQTLINFIKVIDSNHSQTNISESDMNHFFNSQFLQTYKKNTEQVIKGVRPFDNLGRFCFLINVIEVQKKFNVEIKNEFISICESLASKKRQLYLAVSHSERSFQGRNWQDKIKDNEWQRVFSTFLALKLLDSREREQGNASSSFDPISELNNFMKSDFEKKTHIYSTVCRILGTVLIFKHDDRLIELLKQVINKVSIETQNEAEWMVYQALSSHDDYKNMFDVLVKNASIFKRSLVFTIRKEPQRFKEIVQTFIKCSMINKGIYLCTSDYISFGQHIVNLNNLSDIAFLLSSADQLNKNPIAAINLITPILKMQNINAFFQGKFEQINYSKTLTYLFFWILNPQYSNHICTIFSQDQLTESEKLDIIIDKIFNQQRPETKLEIISNALDLFSSRENSNEIRYDSIIISFINNISQSQDLSLIAKKLFNFYSKSLPFISQRLDPLIYFANLDMDLFYSEFMTSIDLEIANLLFIKICSCPPLRDSFYNHYIKNILGFEKPQNLTTPKEFKSNIMSFSVPLSQYNSIFLLPVKENNKIITCTELATEIYNDVNESLFQGKLSSLNNSLLAFYSKASEWLPSFFEEFSNYLSRQEYPISDFILNKGYLISSTTIFSNCMKSSRKSILTTNAAIKCFTLILLYRSNNKYNNLRIVPKMLECIPKLSDMQKGSILMDFKNNLNVLDEVEGKEEECHVFEFLAGLIQHLEHFDSTYIDLFKRITSTPETMIKYYLPLFPKIKDVINEDVYEKDLMELSIYGEAKANEILFEKFEVNSIADLIDLRRDLTDHLKQLALKYHNTEWLSVIFSRIPEVKLPQITLCEVPDVYYIPSYA